MAYLFNDPLDFIEEAVTGYVNAHSNLLRSVRGGVVRSTEVPPNQVAVVIGGGSGHYPAFAGFVGPGLAHAAVIGNVFASPSTQQVINVCKNANKGGGVFMTYGNYAGDVMNFSAAIGHLESLGIVAKHLPLTDDIMSASKAEIWKRRGIAGGLFVYKVTSAAAEENYNLDEVARVAHDANDRTRSIGVAFSGCTLPGESKPLFSIPEGRMAIGLGIHGEPGLAEVNIPSAKLLAEDLVDRLTAEMPEGFETTNGPRIALILNGLGGVKYEELYLIYQEIWKLLQDRGIVIVEPEVGEFVTSFEMAGFSLTFSWLTPELEELWCRPAYSPGFRKGQITFSEVVEESESKAEILALVKTATKESVGCTKTLSKIFELISETVTQKKDELGLLDAIAGDGDHGISMVRGSAAAQSAIEIAVSENLGAGSALSAAANDWSDRAGGTSGVLWGIILQQLANAVGDSEVPTLATIALGISKSVREVMNVGKAQVGDKTLVDVLVPFSDSLNSSADANKSLIDAWITASEIALEAANNTSRLLPKIGRARTHGEKSLGHPDPGSISFAYICNAVGLILKKECRVH